MHVVDLAVFTLEGMDASELRFAATRYGDTYRIASRAWLRVVVRNRLAGVAAAGVLLAAAALPLAVIRPSTLALSFAGAWALGLLVAAWRSTWLHGWFEGWAAEEREAQVERLAQRGVLRAIARRLDHQ